MELLLFVIIATICSGVGYFFFIKKSPGEIDFNLRDKKENRFYDFDDQN